VANVTALTCTEGSDSRGDADLRRRVTTGGAAGVPQQLAESTGSAWPKIMRLSYKRSSLRIALRPADSDWRAVTGWLEFRLRLSKLAKRLCRAVKTHFSTYEPHSWAAPVSTAPAAARRRRPPAATPAQRHTSGLSAPGSTEHSTLPAREQFDRRIELSRSGPAPVVPNAAGRRRLTAPAPRWRSRRPNSVDGDETRRPPLLTAACPGGDWLGVRADSGVQKNGGQWYFEVVVDVPDGAKPGRRRRCSHRAGRRRRWTSARSRRRTRDFGFGGRAGRPTGHQVLAARLRLRLRPGSTLSRAALDLDSGLALFSVNGAEQGQAYSLNRSKRQEGSPRRDLLPAGCARNGANLRWNFGDDPAQPLRHLPGGPWRPAGLAPVNQRTDNPRAWRLNHHDVTGPGLALGPDGASAQGRLGFGWQGVRAAKGVRAVAGGPGRFYY
uniref:B30.2/SPRY domain-containing protein n=1 Tax=Macrostomum lignano TaxID=282301 RepID=A0A1I8JRV5_9PLAT